MALLNDYISNADEFSLQREALWNHMKQALLQFAGRKGKNSDPKKASAHSMSPPSNRKAGQRSLSKS